MENTTKIVSIEAMLEQSDNAKKEQNVDVGTSSRSMIALQIQKMAEIKVIMSPMNIEITGGGMLLIVIFRRMEIEILELTVAILLSFDFGGTTLSHPKLALFYIVMDFMI